MSRPAPVLIASHPHARGPRQMSHANRFAPVGGRGRSARVVRRVHVAAGPLSVPLVRSAWAAFVKRVCGTRENCAVMFGVTFQTACNWFAEFSTPTGDKVMQASRDFPEAYAAMLREVA